MTVLVQLVLTRNVDTSVRRTPWAKDLYNGVVLQAVIGTTLAFGAMLTAYSLCIVRVTLTRFVLAAA